MVSTLVSPIFISIVRDPVELLSLSRAVVTLLSIYFPCETSFTFLTERESSEYLQRFTCNSTQSNIKLTILSHFIPYVKRLRSPIHDFDRRVARYSQWGWHNRSGRRLLVGRSIWDLEHFGSNRPRHCGDDMGYSWNVCTYLSASGIPLLIITLHSSRSSASLVVISCLYGIFSGACEYLSRPKHLKRD